VTIGSENYRKSITKSETHLGQKSILKGEDNAKPILSPILERKLETVTSGLRQASFTGLQTITYDNSSTIADYILAMKTETNLSDNYRRDNIVVLTKFSKYCDNKSFKDTRRDDIIAFLESFRKPETQDPLHKWIGI
jgi:hypothetical protein